MIAPTEAHWPVFTQALEVGHKVAIHCANGVATGHITKVRLTRVGSLEVGLDTGTIVDLPPVRSSLL